MPTVADEAAEYFDPAERALEKERSRQRDAEELANGTKTREQLRRENGAFAFPNVRIQDRPYRRRLR